MRTLRPYQCQWRRFGCHPGYQKADSSRVIENVSSVYLKEAYFLSHLESSRGPSSVKGSNIFTFCSLCIVPKHILSFHCVSNWVESESSVTLKGDWEQFQFFGTFLLQQKLIDQDNWSRSLMTRGAVHIHACCRWIQENIDLKNTSLLPRVHFSWSQRPNVISCIPLTALSLSMCNRVERVGGRRTLFGLHGRCDRVYGFQGFLSLK